MAEALGGSILETRELFWQNVMREMLTSLSVMTAGGIGYGTPGPDGKPTPVLFDGRLGVITSSGSRVPIAAVVPLFACGVGGTEQDKALSIAVECSVFQLHTPKGEVFTLPLHEMRGFHSVSEELMERMAKSVRDKSRSRDERESAEPFGFAAFTSIARSRGSAAPAEREPRHEETPSDESSATPEARG
jgi:hypothetical protein